MAILSPLGSTTIRGMTGLWDPGCARAALHGRQPQCQILLAGPFAWRDVRFLPPEVVQSPQVDLQLGRQPQRDPLINWCLLANDAEVGGRGQAPTWRIPLR